MATEPIQYPLSTAVLRPQRVPYSPEPRSGGPVAPVSVLSALSSIVSTASRTLLPKRLWHPLGSLWSGGALQYGGVIRDFPFCVSAGPMVAPRDVAAKRPRRDARKVAKTRTSASVMKASCVEEHKAGRQRDAKAIDPFQSSSDDEDDLINDGHPSEGGADENVGVEDLVEEKLRVEFFSTHRHLCDDVFGYAHGERLEYFAEAPDTESNTGRRWGVQPKRYTTVVGARGGRLYVNEDDEVLARPLEGRNHRELAERYQFRSIAKGGHIDPAPIVVVPSISAFAAVGDGAGAIGAARLAPGNDGTERAQRALLHLQAYEEENCMKFTQEQLDFLQRAPDLFVEVVEPTNAPSSSDVDSAHSRTSAPGEGTGKDTGAWQPCPSYVILVPQRTLACGGGLGWSGQQMLHIPVASDDSAPVSVSMSAAAVVQTF